MPCPIGVDVEWIYIKRGCFLVIAGRFKLDSLPSGTTGAIATLSFKKNVLINRLLPMCGVAAPSVLRSTLHGIILFQPCELHFLL